MTGAKPAKRGRILLLGVVYTKDVDDVRESSALDILHLLQAKGAEVRHHDPHVPAFAYDGLEMASVNDLEGELVRADCVAIATDHSCIDWSRVRGLGDCVVDTRRVVTLTIALNSQKLLSKGLIWQPILSPV